MAARKLFSISFEALRQGTMQRDSLGVDALVDAIAERIVAKLRSEFERTRDGITPRLLTVEQAAQYLSRSPASVRHLINAGKLPVSRLDGRVFLDIVNLNRIIDESKELAK
jgi:excisionase family DNA binding protein